MLAKLYKYYKRQLDTNLTYNKVNLYMICYFATHIIHYHNNEIR